MDVPYDRIQESTLSLDRSSTPTPAEPGSTKAKQPTLNEEFQDTFRAFQNSPWGTKIGGLWGNVRKQGETYYEGARKEAEAASGEALKGLSGLRDNIVEKTKGLSLTDPQTGQEEGKPVSDEKGVGTGTVARKISGEDLHENDSFMARFRTQASKGIKEIQKAEDAADEALLRFGTNVRDFLREAVSIAPPSDEDAANMQASGESSVLFESKDPTTGKRVIHTSRFDANLHVVHSNLDGFLRDPVSPEWEGFKKTFRIDEKTEDIAMNLEKYPELRRAMEQCVPEKADYGDFWCRYYFYRKAIESEEQKRRELLQGASTAEEEGLGWDEDSEEENPSTPQARTAASHKTADSIATLKQKTPDDDLLKPEGRNSNENSVAGSDTSYDIISSQASAAPGSPKDDKSKSSVPANKDDDSDEDWE